MMAAGVGADLILHAHRVLSPGTGIAEATSVAIRGRRLLAVGCRAQVHQLAGPATEELEFPDATVLPGLSDVHTHIAGRVEQTSRGTEVACGDLLTGVRSVRDILDRMAAAGRQASPGEWLVGRASPMQEYRLSERRLPTRQELDGACPDHPAYVMFGGHLMVANSRALAAVGLTRDSADPPGGAIERGAGGEPSGVLKETAQDPVHKNRRPAYTDANLHDLDERLHAELVTCAAMGVTTVHEIIRDPAEVLAYTNLAAANRLPVRVQLLFRVVESPLPRWGLRDLGLVPGFGSDLLRLGGVKMSIDGGFTGGHGAFYPLPTDGDRLRPVIRISQDELTETVDGYHRAGMRVCVHAIGDQALDMALAAFERALTGQPRADHRHRIEHGGNWLMTAERRRRIADLALTVVPNPPFLHYLGEELVTSLGEKRSAGALPIRSMLAEGLSVAIASDAPGPWPVDPLRDVASLVHRTTRRGTPFSPGEAIDVTTGLALVTRTAAWTGFMADRLGTLEPGKYADLVVIDADPESMTVGPAGGLPIRLTICDGRITYRR